MQIYLELFLNHYRSFTLENILSMDFFINNVFPLVLSAISIAMTLMAGGLKKNAWLLGLFNQVLWLLWILYTSVHGKPGNIGFLAMNIAFWIVYGRNHLKWKRDRRLS